MSSYQNRYSVCNSLLGSLQYYTTLTIVNDMNRITKCLFYADAITLYIWCNDTTREELKRLCLVASVQFEEKKNSDFNSNVYLVIKSVKDMDRIFPTMKKKFIQDMHLEDEYIKTMKGMFREDVK